MSKSCVGNFRNLYITKKKPNTHTHRFSDIFFITNISDILNIPGLYSSVKQCRFFPKVFQLTLFRNKFQGICHLKYVLFESESNILFN